MGVNVMTLAATAAAGTTQAHRNARQLPSRKPRTVSRAATARPAGGRCLRGGGDEQTGQRDAERDETQTYPARRVHRRLLHGRRWEDGTPTKSPLTSPPRSWRNRTTSPNCWSCPDMAACLRQLAPSEEF